MDQFTRIPWAGICAYVLRKHAYSQQASLIQSDAIEVVGRRHDGFRSCPQSFKAPKIAPSRVVCPVTWPSSSQLTVNAVSERTRSPFSRVHDHIIFFKHTINEFWWANRNVACFRYIGCNYEREK